MKIKVLCHSSLKIETEGKVIYVDPFKIKKEAHDANIIMITHSHYDHFSEEAIQKVKNETTKIVITEDLLNRALELGFAEKDIMIVLPNHMYSILDIEINTIPAYNTNKKFHPKENKWVGYLLNLENQKLYIAGDTDITTENKEVKCDIALVPIGRNVYNDLYRSCPTCK